MLWVTAVHAAHSLFQGLRPKSAWHPWGDVFKTPAGSHTCDAQITGYQRQRRLKGLSSSPSTSHSSFVTQLREWIPHSHPPRSVGGSPQEADLRSGQEKVPLVLPGIYRAVVKRLHCAVTPLEPTRVPSCRCGDTKCLPRHGEFHCSKNCIGGQLVDAASCWAIPVCGKQAGLGSFSCTVLADCKTRQDLLLTVLHL
jgi:hypothetical protein